MISARYNDTEKQQEVRVAGYSVNDRDNVIIIMQNTMANINLCYPVTLSDFISKRFVEAV